MRLRRAGRPEGKIDWTTSAFLLCLLTACHHPAPEAVETAEAVPVTVATAHAGPIHAVDPHPHDMDCRQAQDCAGHARYDLLAVWHTDKLL